jgi:hypothetical protein
MVSLPAFAGGQVRAFVPRQKPVPMKNRFLCPSRKIGAATTNRIQGLSLRAGRPDFFLSVC